MQIPSFNLICGLLLFQPSPQPFPNSHLMLPELEVCPCSYLSDPRLSRPLAFPSPFLLQAEAFPPHIPECQEHVLCSHRILLPRVHPTPPHLLLLMEKGTKASTSECAELCTAAEVSI